jgi:hypothetical protein
MSELLSLREKPSCRSTCCRSRWSHRTAPCCTNASRAASTRCWAKRRRYGHLMAEVARLRARGDLHPACRRCAASATARRGNISTARSTAPSHARDRHHRHAPVGQAPADLAAQARCVATSHIEFVHLEDGRAVLVEDGVRHGQVLRLAPCSAARSARSGSGGSRSCRPCRRPGLPALPGPAVRAGRGARTRAPSARSRRDGRSSPGARSRGRAGCGRSSWLRGRRRPSRASRSLPPMRSARMRPAHAGRFAAPRGTGASRARLNTSAVSSVGISMWSVSRTRRK